MILILALVYGGLLHFVSLGLPGVQFGKGHGLPIVWREMGRQIECVENDLEKKTNREPLIVGMDRYYLASELAFYRDKFINKNDPLEKDESVANTTSCQFFEREGLMYAYWFPSSPIPERPLILVSQHKSDLECPEVVGHLRTLESIKTLIIEKNGREVTRLYYRIGNDYHRDSVPAGKPIAKMEELNR